MGDGHEIEDFLLKVINNANAANGSIIGNDMATNTLQLGKDEKDARIKDIVDRYLQGEKVEIDVVAQQFGITNKDIIKELALREARKLLGK